MNQFKYEPHKYIELLSEARKFSKHPISLTSFSDVLLPKPFSRHPMLYQLANPFCLAKELGKRRNNGVIFVREFMTIPLLLAAHVLWPYRKNTLFVMVHNIQMAHLRLRDRIALKILFKLKYRFVSLESSAGISELGIANKDAQVLNLPLAHYAAVKLKEVDSNRRRRTTVGIVGRLRPEKDIELLFNAIDDVLRSGRVDVDILIGCNNEEILKEGARRGFRTVDTASPENYDEALRLSDIVVVNYNTDRYRYRTSGVIADAIFRGTYVVCPDYPVFKAQVSVPCAVGTTFKCLEELPSAIEMAVNLVQDGQDSFKEYIRYRQPEHLAEKIDAWIESHA